MSVDSMYKCFPRFVFRCPLLPSNSTELDFNNSLLIQEAIYLASPDLYDALKSAHKEFDHTNGEIDLKQKLALLKYYSRMTHRCTPFGIFAGCGVGEFDKKSEIIIDDFKSFSSTTRLDMDYLCTLVDSLTKHPQINDRLQFYPNSSLYPLFRAYRYIEFYYVNGKRKYYLTEIESNEIIAEIIRVTEPGLLKSEVIAHLVTKDVPREVAEPFVADLIQSQVLVSNLMPGVTGDDVLQELIKILTWLNIPNEVITPLLYIRDQLRYIDENNIGRKDILYKSIEREVTKLGVKYDKRFLFQSDMAVKPSKAILDDNIMALAQKGLKVLNRLTPYVETPILKKFKEDFYKRYEEEEIPLSEVLDTDIGIGFNKLLPGKTDIHPLIDNVPQALNRSPRDTPPTAQEIFLLEKYSSCIRNGDTEIKITEEDLAEFSESWNDLPTTLSSIIEVLQSSRPDGPAPFITMRAAGGPSGANLLSRFSHIHPEIKEHVLNITEMEQNALNEDEILAEVCHLPEARTGNILCRPTLRKYEIPFLAKHSVDTEFSIPITDLMVSIKDSYSGRYISLRSKRLNKKVIPILTSAHNFSYNSLPVYHFLSCLHADKIRISLQFNWGKLVGNKKFYPRVSYENIVLSPATWNISSMVFKKMLAITNENFMEQINLFKDEFKLPDKVLLVNGDNKLFIDLREELYAKLLVTEAQRRDFQLEEYLFNDVDSCIKGHLTNYNNEIIVSFHKKDLSA